MRDNHRKAVAGAGIHRRLRQRHLFQGCTICRRFGQPLRGREAGATGNDIVIGGRPFWTLARNSSFAKRDLYMPAVCSPSDVPAGTGLKARAAQEGAGFPAAGLAAAQPGDAATAKTTARAILRAVLMILMIPSFVRRGGARAAYSSRPSPALS
jgi:hypothetical protein